MIDDLTKIIGGIIFFAVWAWFVAMYGLIIFAALLETTKEIWGVYVRRKEKS